MDGLKISRLQVDKKNKQDNKNTSLLLELQKGPKTKFKMEAKRSPKNYWDN